MKDKTTKIKEKPIEELVVEEVKSISMGQPECPSCKSRRQQLIMINNRKAGIVLDLLCLTCGYLQRLPILKEDAV